MQSWSSEPASSPGSRNRTYSQFNPARQSSRPQFQAGSLYDSGPNASPGWQKSQGFPGQYLVPAPYARFAGQTDMMSPPTVYQSPPSLAYPSGSLAHPTLLYQAPYQQSHQYMASPADTGQSTWWYVPDRPNHASSPYETYPGQYSYNFSMSPREVDPYGQPDLLSPQYPLSPAPPAAAYPPPMEPQTQSGASPEALAQTRFLSMRSRSTGALPTLKPNLSSPGSGPKGKRAAGLGRYPYHPNPPAHGSEWVMWVGNVPQDASHDELWRFFTQSSTARFSISGTGDRVDELSGGVVSIFLIAHSSCAFVNFQTEPHLQAAIARFTGLPLRPGDYHCPRLVCRVRGRDDDLKAGVGGQRGSGIHVRWIKNQKEKARLRDERHALSSSEHTMTSSSLQTATSPSLLVDADDNGGTKELNIPRMTPQSSTSGSCASTNSGMLARYFPKRYFILKSLTQFDLDLSVKQGVWATQRHNEGILDQAFRTSTDVYLIFGVNKSGEFYGYAKMSSPITHGEHPVSWASRSPDPSLHVSSSQGPVQASKLPVGRDSAYFTPNEHWIDNSPLPISPDPRPPSDESPSPLKAATDVHERDFFSAPAELMQPHHKLTMSPQISHSVDESRPTGPLTHQQHSEESSIELDHEAEKAAFKHDRDAREDSFKLDHEAPGKAMREQASADDDGVKRWDTAPDASLPAVTVDAYHPEESSAAAADEGAAWGKPFKVEWVHMGRIPFHRTRHLRNPWNHDREVKVSRDGTELDPTVGQALLDEWDHPQPSEPAQKRRERAAKAATSGARGAGDA